MLATGDRVGKGTRELEILKQRERSRNREKSAAD
jgi:hypothetical protein